MYRKHLKGRGFTSGLENLRSDNTAETAATHTERGVPARQKPAPAQVDPSRRAMWHSQRESVNSSQRESVRELAKAESSLSEDSFSLNPDIRDSSELEEVESAASNAIESAERRSSLKGRDSSERRSAEETYGNQGQRWRRGRMLARTFKPGPQWRPELANPGVFEFQANGGLPQISQHMVDVKELTKTLRKYREAQAAYQQEQEMLELSSALDTSQPQDVASITYQIDQAALCEETSASQAKPPSGSRGSLQTPMAYGFTAADGHFGHAHKAVKSGHRQSLGTSQKQTKIKSTLLAPPRLFTRSRQEPPTAAPPPADEDAAPSGGGEECLLASETPLTLSELNVWKPACTCANCTKLSQRRWLESAVVEGCDSDEGSEDEASNAPWRAQLQRLSSVMRPKRRHGGQHRMDDGESDQIEVRDPHYNL